MDTTQILLSVATGLASWALKTTLENSKRVAELSKTVEGIEKAAVVEKSDVTRRFDDVGKKLDRIENLLTQALLGHKIGEKQE